MGIINKMFSKEDKVEEVPVPEAEVAPEIVEEVDESPVPEEKPQHNPTVPYVPAPKPDPTFDPDSNEKDSKTPSFL